ncbi:aspartate carbamoyltransferase [Candidatus Woesearchaeota archaeon]|nr:aspartate carbamoyltransferase [Candidatus Woesearchaeota archaeon]
MESMHIISTKQFLDKKILGSIFKLADDMEEKDRAGILINSLKGKILASLFYEPSTRTRFSFESAMHKLGGNVISTESAIHFSSVTKGESLQDTIKIISGYSDIIILRHFKEGSAEIASRFSSVPIINAGDGMGEHPTQALLDLYTIKKEFGNIDNIKIALLGDLLYGRTIHSLLHLLGAYNVDIFLISPEQLKLPEKYKNYLDKKGIDYKEIDNIKKIIKEIDVLYVTRIQKERFNSEDEYEKLKNSYKIDSEMLKEMKDNAIIMHPLPRVNEISTDIDDDKRAAYFRQAKNGLYIRMALLEMIFKKN